MNPDSDYQRLCEISWRRDLTEAEAAALRTWLGDHPDAEADWDGEKQMTRALRDLPNAPVPSNFTARVLESLDQESRQKVAARHFTWIGLGWIRPAAFAACLVTLTFVLVHHRQIEARQQLARSIAPLAEAQPPVLLDYDAIRLMSKASAPDLASTPDAELLTLLK